MCYVFSFDLCNNGNTLDTNWTPCIQSRKIHAYRFEQFDNFANCKVLVDWIRQPLVMESSSYLDFSRCRLICDLECATVSCDKWIQQQKHTTVTTGNELLPNNM